MHSSLLGIKQYESYERTKERTQLSAIFSCPCYHQGNRWTFDFRYVGNLSKFLLVRHLFIKQTLKQSAPGIGKSLYRYRDRGCDIAIIRSYHIDNTVFMHHMKNCNCNINESLLSDVWLPSWAAWTHCKRHAYSRTATQESLYLCIAVLPLGTAVGTSLQCYILPRTFVMQYQYYE